MKERFFSRLAVHYFVFLYVSLCTLLQGMEKSTNTTVNGNKYIWELFKGLGLNKRIDEEVFMTYSLSECWKYVDEYIF